DVLYVQVGGGALLSAVWQGLRDARALGRISRLPRLVSVQTEGAWPLRRAWLRLGLHGSIDLADAARHRSRYMWPWEEPPHSIAHGILDDETYDWWACCQAMAETGGDALVVDEDTLRRAHTVARDATGLAVSHTGSAGLAGWLAAPPSEGETAGVLLTGVDRGA
ncbi:MAG: pyridoxal-phosphate dependent enzyme, partial [Deltaproteobacteria bacterium]